MKPRFAIRFEQQARTLFARAQRTAGYANELFVHSTRHFEEALLQRGRAMASRGISTIPEVTSTVASAAYKLGRRAEEDAKASNSVVVSSVPAALYRTAACISWLGDSSARGAQEMVRALCAPHASPQEQLNERYRKIGRSVASLVREGLDALVVARTLTSALDEVRRLKRASRSRGELR